MKKTTILIIAVLFMVIGYAAYNTTINIYGNGKLAENLSDFKVYLSNLKVNGKEVSGINNTKDEFTINDINGDISVDIVNDSTEYDTKAYLDCDVDNTWDFDYTGGEQTFTAPITGTYKLEVWGAQGGSGSFNNYSNDKAGYGGYSLGLISINSSSKIYINVGGAGGVVNSINGSAGGYNGGGNGEATCEGFKYPGGGGGGGATHISGTSGILPTLSNKIDNIMIVAGGGGGAGLYNGGYNQGGGYAGSGGGFVGGDATTTNLRPIIGGTQTTGYSFGLGETSTACHYAVDGNWGNGGGGGGFYGGFASSYTTGTYTNGGGAGGSGYIGNPLLTEKSMYCYNCTESNEISIKTVSTTCVNSNPTENCAKLGNGYARITLISSPTSITTDKVTISAQESTSQNLKNVTGKTLTCKLKVNKISRTEKKEYTGPTEWTFDYTGGEQTFTAPITGTYKLEAWGAQGGSGINTNQGSTNYVRNGGFGGYSSGEISILKNSVLYINIGGQGEDGTSTQDIGVKFSGGYNGGGNGLYYSGGGGATHIATKSGILSSLHNSINYILIVSGGGGGTSAHYLGGGYCIGGSGGGIQGQAGYNGDSTTYLENGSSQTNGFSFGKGENSQNPSSGCATAGGGGGFYGGKSPTNFSTSWNSCSGGGSGYIGNTLLSKKGMYCYNCTESSEISTKTISTTCTSATPTVNCSKQGNGYARITLISY